MMRCVYRKDNAMGASRPIIQKGGKYRKEHLLASAFEKGQKNDSFGFRCLHLSVSEANEYAKINVVNKYGVNARVGIRTRPDTATAPEDYEHIDEIITFNVGEESRAIDVRIVDDEGWEPDENFFVELYDPQTRQRLVGRDTECMITILDDDKPGCFAFEDSNMRHAVTSSICTIRVQRQHDSDGNVSCKWKTCDYETAGRAAVAGIEYEAQNGTINFGDQETSAEI